MNVEIATEAAQFPGKEYINGIFLAVWLSWWEMGGKVGGDGWLSWREIGG